MKRSHKKERILLDGMLNTEVQNLMRRIENLEDIISLHTKFRMKLAKNKLFSILCTRTM